MKTIISPLTQGLFQKLYFKNVQKNTKVIFSGLDPADLFRPPDLPPESAGFGTFAEKYFTISETSNSCPLRWNLKPIITTRRILKAEIKCIIIKN